MNISAIVILKDDDVDAVFVVSEQDASFDNMSYLWGLARRNDLPVRVQRVRVEGSQPFHTFSQVREYLAEMIQEDAQ